MTHDEDPWKNTRGNLRPEVRCNEDMDKLEMRNFYAMRIDKDVITELQN